MRASLASLLLLPTLAAQESPATPAPEASPPLTLKDAFPKQAKFDRPIFLAHTAQDGDHYYVVEQYGLVHRIPRDGNQAEREVFLDWTAKTFHPKNGGHNEEGLLGFAFDPAYETNRHVYIYYSHRHERGKRRSVVSRLTAVDGIAGPLVPAESELEILVVNQPFGNHNGGTIVFGHDNMLYVALGDGGAANDPFKAGQNFQTLLGKILRIDVRGATQAHPYGVPADNPFAGEREDGARGEIWAYGLRNPWRMAFDSKTGELWCGDVGQDTWEEVDRIVKGGNYGWNLREAHVAFKGAEVTAEVMKTLTEPVAYYPRREGISITGGYVYRGAAHEGLVGAYVYADFVSGHVWAVHEDRAGGKHRVERIAEAGGRQVASFAELPDGELLLLCYDGRIHGLQARDD